MLGLQLLTLHTELSSERSCEVRSMSVHVLKNVNIVITKHDKKLQANIPSSFRRVFRVLIADDEENMSVSVLNCVFKKLNMSK